MDQQQRTGWDVERHRITVFPLSLSTFMTQTTLLQYEAPYDSTIAGPVHAIDWCKSPAPGQQLRPRSAFRLGIASFAEDFRNRIAVVGLQDDRVNHGYPATALQWQPGSASSFAWSQKSPTTELLATTGDSLRVFEYTSDAPLASSSYAGATAQRWRAPPLAQSRTIWATQKPPTPQRLRYSNLKYRARAAGAPLTNFSWNEKIPSLVVTSSIDTTCTVWNLDTSTAVTQLIAHDREVYDVAWLPGSTDIFVSVGADGSLRAFDLRSLEHSTILYETPPPKNQPPSGRPPSSPLLRIAFNPSDANYMSTFHQDGSDVQILDMRSPGAPVMELRAHRAPINAAGWSSTEGGLVATAADDCQLLLWDISPHAPAPAASPRNASSRLSSPRPTDGKKRVLTDPIMAYSGQNEITNLAWSPQIAPMTMNTGHSTQAGEWIRGRDGQIYKGTQGIGPGSPSGGTTVP
ncbi:WD40 repeat-like protein [Lactarius akahatsu]|uniref:WD40 repeat-like protein n=1 Tax=Lactarius akahatsu TaxID=416441 RepID=A0AAD4QEH2_9AGAM|nr:WD40 repeat-like protein [Lactarius akahatsu]